MFAVRDLTFDELSQLPPLIRFETLATMKVGALRAYGLILEPTGRNPRHYDVTFTDLDEGVSSLQDCDHKVVLNPYYEG